MKKLKTFFIVLLVIIFITSTLFNILLFGSSYGSLMLKKDTNLLQSMSWTDVSSNTLAGIKSQKNKGYLYQEKVYNGDELEKSLEYYIYFDETSSPTYTYTLKEGESETKIYYNGEFLYTEKGESKLKKKLTEIQLASNINAIVGKIVSFHESAYTSITTVEDKNLDTSISFSFSPFYFIGINVEIDNEDNDSEFGFDLNGNLRKGEYEFADDSKAEIKLSTKTSEIEFPDFYRFALEK